jgi:hypothetical protein
LFLEAEEVLEFQEELAVAEDVLRGVLIVIRVGGKKVEIIVLVCNAEVKNCKGVRSVT